MRYKVNLKKQKKVILFGCQACLVAGLKGKQKRKHWKTLKMPYSHI